MTLPLPRIRRQPCLRRKQTVAFASFRSAFVLISANLGKQPSDAVGGAQVSGSSRIRKSLGREFRRTWAMYPA